jgi:peptide/nickel transport system substrate-binding protein
MRSIQHFHDTPHGVSVRLNRRELLRRGAVFGILATAGSGLLAACGGSSTTPSATSGQTGGSGAASTATSPATSGGQGSPSAQSSGSSGTPKKGGTVTFPVATSPTSWDLSKADWPAWEAVNFLYDQLLQADAQEQLQPMLAKSWEVSDDALSYTLHLRTDVKFHDGTPFNAAAVKYNLQQILDAPDSAQYTDFQYVTAIDTPDDATVKLTLKQVVADMLYNLAGWGSIQLSPTAKQKLGDNWASHPVGTGAFKFDSYVADSHINYVRNDDYWNGAPLLDGVVVKIIPEDSVQIDNLQAKSVDALLGVQPKNVDTVKKLGVEVNAKDSPGIQLVSMNVSQAPTDQLAVRQAIAHAINRDEIIKKVLFGYATKARAGAWPGSPYDFPDIPYMDYDPDKSASILDQAGWKKGSDGIREKDGTKLFLNILSSDHQDWLLYTQIFQDQLKQVGIDSKINSYEWGTYLQDWRANKENWNLTYMSLGSLFGSTRVIMAGWEPDAYWNVNQIDNATAPELKDLATKLTDLENQLSKTSDVEQRKTLGKQVEQLNRDNQLSMWLWHSQVIMAVQPYVKDYQATWHGRVIDLKKAWLDK